MRIIQRIIFKRQTAISRGSLLQRRPRKQDITTTSTHDVVPSLRVKADFWRGLTSDPFVISSILGYRIEFIESPPLALPSGGGALSRLRENMKALDEEVQSLHVKGAIETALNPTLGFYSHLFIVPKKGGGQRPVINLKPLNAYVVKKSFHMTTLKEVTQAIRKDDWSITIDLKDAFLHIPVHMDYRRFLRFIWRWRTYQFSQLPFGLTSSPQAFTDITRPLFTDITRPLMEECRLLGIRIIFYLDDILLLASSRREAGRQKDIVLDLLVQAGLRRNPAKCRLTPSQTFPYLGLDWDTGDESLPTSQQAR